MRISLASLIALLLFCTLPAAAQTSAHTPAQTPAQPAQPLTQPGHSPVSLGHVVHRVTPTYPPDAWTRKITGSVVIAATIQRDGTLADVFALSGPEELRQAAIDAVSQWIYSPFTIAGDPTIIDTRITVTFARAVPAPTHPDPLSAPESTPADTALSANAGAAIRP